MTELMYTENPDSYHATAQITDHGSDAKGVYMVLDRSIFYPQGGGQPADQGEITAANVAYKVRDVRNVDGQVRHYIIDDGDSIHAGADVRMSVDQKRRAINSKYHTAGHYIAAVAEKISCELTAIKGHQFPGEAYVEFTGAVDNTEDFFNKITNAIKDGSNGNATVTTNEVSSSDASIIAANLPYDIPEEKTFRVCHIEGYTPVPCGGTHVKTLSEISTLKIKKCKSKKGKTKICYEVI